MPDIVQHATWLTYYMSIQPENKLLLCEVNKSHRLGDWLAIMYISTTWTNYSIEWKKDDEILKNNCKKVFTTVTARHVCR